MDGELFKMSHNNITRSILGLFLCLVSLHFQNSFAQDIITVEFVEAPAIPGMTPGSTTTFEVSEDVRPMLTRAIQDLFSSGDVEAEGETALSRLLTQASELDLSDLRARVSHVATVDRQQGVYQIEFVHSTGDRLGEGMRLGDSRLGTTDTSLGSSFVSIHTGQELRESEAVFDESVSLQTASLTQNPSPRRSALQVRVVDFQTATRGNYGNGATYSALWAPAPISPNAENSYGGQGWIALQATDEQISIATDLVGVVSAAGVDYAEHVDVAVRLPGSEEDYITLTLQEAVSLLAMMEAGRDRRILGFNSLSRRNTLVRLGRATSRSAGAALVLEEVLFLEPMPTEGWAHLVDAQVDSYHDSGKVAPTPFAFALRQLAVLTQQQGQSALRVIQALGAFGQTELLSDLLLAQIASGSSLQHRVYRDSVAGNALQSLMGDHAFEIYETTIRALAEAPNFLDLGSMSFIVPNRDRRVYHQVARRLIRIPGVPAGQTDPVLSNDTREASLELLRLAAIYSHNAEVAIMAAQAYGESASHQYVPDDERSAANADRRNRFGDFVSFSLTPANGSVFTTSSEVAARVISDAYSSLLFFAARSNIDLEDAGFAEAFVASQAYVDIFVPMETMGTTVPSSGRLVELRPQDNRTDMLTGFLSPSEVSRFVGFASEVARHRVPRSHVVQVENSGEVTFEVSAGNVTEVLRMPTSTAIAGIANVRTRSNSRWHDVGAFPGAQGSRIEDIVARNSHVRGIIAQEGDRVGNLYPITDPWGYDAWPGEASTGEMTQYEAIEYVQRFASWYRGRLDRILAPDAFSVLREHNAFAGGHDEVVRADFERRVRAAQDRLASRSFDTSETLHSEAMLQHAHITALIARILAMPHLRPLFYEFTTAAAMSDREVIEFLDMVDQASYVHIPLGTYRTGSGDDASAYRVLQLFWSEASEGSSEILTLRAPDYVNTALGTPRTGHAIPTASEWARAERVRLLAGGGILRDPSARNQRMPEIDSLVHERNRTERDVEVARAFSHILSARTRGNMPTWERSWQDVALSGRELPMPDLSLFALTRGLWPAEVYDFPRQTGLREGPIQSEQYNTAWAISKIAAEASDRALRDLAVFVMEDGIDQLVRALSSERGSSTRSQAEQELETWLGAGGRLERGLRSYSSRVMEHTIDGLQRILTLIVDPESSNRDAIDTIQTRAREFLSSNRAALTRLSGHSPNLAESVALLHQVEDGRLHYSEMHRAQLLELFDMMATWTDGQSVAQREQLRGLITALDQQRTSPVSSEASSPSRRLTTHLAAVADAERATRSMSDPFSEQAIATRAEHRRRSGQYRGPRPTDMLEAVIAGRAAIENPALRLQTRELEMTARRMRMR